LQISYTIYQLVCPDLGILDVALGELAPKCRRFYNTTVCTAGDCCSGLFNKPTAEEELREK